MSGQKQQQCTLLLNGEKRDWIQVSVFKRFLLHSPILISVPPVSISYMQSSHFIWDSGNCDLGCNFEKNIDVICSLKFKSISLDYSAVEVGQSDRDFRY